jgi:four helix bundle protein
MPPYERFDAWKASHELALELFKATDRWPIRERYALAAQARRAAFSVPANIVEGSCKKGRAEFRRYLNIALGSLGELGYTIRFARDYGILTVVEWERLNRLHDRAGKLLWGLYNSLRTEDQKATNL